jgi:hypothetical protein
MLVGLSDSIRSHPFEFSLSGPTELGLCDRLDIRTTLRGTLGDLTRLHGNWTLDGFPGLVLPMFLGSSSTNLAISAADLSAAALKASGGNKTEFVTTVRLSATNSLSQVFTATLPINMTSTPPPMLYIIGGSERVVPGRASLIRVEAYGKRARATCDDVTATAANSATPPSSSSSLVFSWTTVSPQDAGSWGSAVNQSSTLAATTGEWHLDPSVLAEGGRVLALQPYALKAGKYVLRVEAVETDITGRARKATSTLTLNVGSSTVQAVIAGGTRRSVGAGTTLELNAGDSFDPDNAVDRRELNYRWSCSFADNAVSSSAKCPMPVDTSSSRLAPLVLGTAETGRTIRYTVQVSRTTTGTTTGGTEWSKAFQDITIAKQEQSFLPMDASSSSQAMGGGASSTTATQPVPVVRLPVVLTVYVKSGFSVRGEHGDTEWVVNPTDTVRLIGFPESGGNRTTLQAMEQWQNDVKWQSTDLDMGDKSLFQSPVTAQWSLVIRPSALPFTRYTFRLVAGASTASITLRPNQPPRDGTLVVTPPRGQAVHGVFEASTFGWADDAPSLPLKYRFAGSYDLAGGTDKVFLGGLRELQTRSFRLPGPPGSQQEAKVRVWATAVDQFGSESNGDDGGSGTAGGAVASSALGVPGASYDVTVFTVAVSATSAISEATKLEDLVKTQVEDVLAEGRQADALQAILTVGSLLPRLSKNASTTLRSIFTTTLKSLTPPRTVEDIEMVAQTLAAVMTPDDTTAQANAASQTSQSLGLSEEERDVVERTLEDAADRSASAATGIVDSLVTATTTLLDHSERGSLAQTSFIPPPRDKDVAQLGTSVGTTLSAVLESCPDITYGGDDVFADATTYVPAQPTGIAGMSIGTCPWYWCKPAQDAPRPRRLTASLATTLDSIPKILLNLSSLLLHGAVAHEDQRKVFTRTVALGVQRLSRQRVNGVSVQVPVPHGTSKKASNNKMAGQEAGGSFQLPGQLNSILGDAAQDVDVLTVSYVRSPHVLSQSAKRRLSPLPQNAKNTTASSSVIRPWSGHIYSLDLRRPKPAAVMIRGTTAGSRGGDSGVSGGLETDTVNVSGLSESDPLKVILPVVLPDSTSGFKTQPAFWLTWGWPPLVTDDRIMTACNFSLCMSHLDPTIQGASAAEACGQTPAAAANIYVDAVGRVGVMRDGPRLCPDVCSFYDTSGQTWSQTGCKAAKYIKQGTTWAVECHCTHATAFSAALDRIGTRFKDRSKVLGNLKVSALLLVVLSLNVGMVVMCLGSVFGGKYVERRRTARAYKASVQSSLVVLKTHSFTQMTKKASSANMTSAKSQATLLSARRDLEAGGADSENIDDFSFVFVPRGLKGSKASPPPRLAAKRSSVNDTSSFDASPTTATTGRQMAVLNKATSIDIDGEEMASPPLDPPWGSAKKKGRRRSSQLPSQLTRAIKKTIVINRMSSPAEVEALDDTPSSSSSPPWGTAKKKGRRRSSQLPSQLTRAIKKTIIVNRMSTSKENQGEDGGGNDDDSAPAERRAKKRTSIIVHSSNQPTEAHEQKRDETTGPNQLPSGDTHTSFTTSDLSSSRAPRSNSAPETMDRADRMSGRSFRSNSLPSGFELHLDLDEEFDISPIGRGGGSEGRTAVKRVSLAPTRGGVGRLNRILSDNGDDDGGGGSGGGGSGGDDGDGDEFRFENPAHSSLRGLRRPQSMEFMSISPTTPASASASALSSSSSTSSAAVLRTSSTATASSSKGCEHTPTTPAPTMSARRKMMSRASTLSEAAATSSHNFTPLAIELRFDVKKMSLFRYCLINLAEYHYLLRIFLG